ncbi:D-alanyl-D-alanine carboxypeptidase/D-alanyl-D-alanine-endopeptidase [Corynebacterium cystitidis]|uniref:D-alanyl-D-alanine carboxypeptidase / D-alanyl-D-alanine-endopeptidase (Penicillin-binding protein 4) n=1 Tax=Corynebacterium cystitidis DSM 20524 TaxID=1121357 RepID=A0A1H9V6V6_9CORY|nr:D-alanyl-D-alanine carboxypeptidase [Corynebacterium cystitidis]WJY83314.1 D-alanyl-D-alanine carboxypeptidase DacB precursor [Corynebacterium cystitidis DSM 20524]SES17412.1 D-alanyl-D-alanine carboxypeptidase / D-alanyl-D-alanine-endopeptidase (penicillin-binding protein 4) [Corynebacterium cystitidis DSM 20524]SNV63457.1 D-alanyl-D-alanine carboxypeptidase [Corynebacterium cystitidis]
MSGKKTVTAIAAVVALGAVGAVAGTGYYVHSELSQLEVAPAYAMPEAADVLVPATPETINRDQLTATLQALADDPALGTFHARVSDAFTGEVLFDASSDQPLTPASSTKVLTTAAALYTLDPADRITTQVVRGANEGDVVIKAAGDVWLTEDTVAQLAEQIGQANAVFVDTRAWSGQQEMMPEWDPGNVDAGYVAPLQPVMINAGRIGATEGDVPRSHTPALDVAQAVAGKVGAATVGYSEAAEGAEVIAEVHSPELIERLRVMMKNSDNVMAEAIGREVAAARVGGNATVLNAPQHTLDVLGEHGYDLTGVTLADNSGLSTLNNITPALIDDILLRSADLASSVGGERGDVATSGADEGGALASSVGGERGTLALLLTTLPVAGGEGTLTTRYGDLQGKGWVRAKTGTLTGVNALAGTVTSDKGNVYTFAFLSNGVEIDPARRAMDTMASALRDF